MSAILTTYQGAFLGPIARLLGYILEAIYSALSYVGIENTAICIILFTFLVNALMLPLQIKQQKFAKMSSIMNPELQAIQAKYKNKKDQASQQKMSLETQAVYQKYGVSPASGCLPLLISMPILFALYRVIYNVPAYVSHVYDLYSDVAKSLQDLNVTVEQLAKYVSTKTYVINDAVMNAKENGKELSYYIDVLGQYNTAAWNDLAAHFKNNTVLVDAIENVSKRAANINSFFGLNIADSPKIKSISISIPILSVVTQILSTKLSMAGNPQQDNSDNPTAASMKMMTNVMPFVSGAMCFMFPIGVGLYWVAGNVFRIFQSLIINFIFSKMDMEEQMKKNMEKTKRRYEKMGIDPNTTLQDISKKRTSNIVANDAKKSDLSSAANAKPKKEIKRTNNTNYKEGSIAAYANMLGRNTNTFKDNKK